MLTSPKDVLIRARKRLEDPARWERVHFQVQGRYCLLASLGYTGCLTYEASVDETEIPHISNAFRLLKQTVQDYTGDRTATIGGFNGRNSTQHSDILKVLDTAIDKSNSIS